MMKYTGIILLSGAISMYGAHLSNKVKEETAVRKALYDLLIHIKCCMENGALPLDKIYKSFDSKVLEKTGFLQKLKSGKSDSFYFALTESSIRISEEIRELYLQIAQAVGKSRFRTEETEQLSRYMSLIQMREAPIMKKDEARQELYKKLGVLCGLLAALLLV